MPSSDEIRFVQLTPPGSACSIAIGRGITEMEPGSLDNLQIVIAWGRFVGFADPDGNRWALQQLPNWSAKAGS